MPTACYRFLTTWILDAPRDAIWEAIYCVEKWPEWWRGVEAVEKLDGGDENGLGSVYRHRWRSRLPYTIGFDMRTTRIEAPFLLEGEARGELEGVGRWRFYEGDAAAVTYEWRVRTTRAWMNALTPVGRPVFVWSHNVVMGWGGECLARRLGAPLLART
ncbi:MAG: SRPBCC family protein [Thermoleophilia bacterium]|nr:SRPBCC family protein [Thermoleophilia bacterium]MDQ3858909.1 SRPBCC family protein [Actinomycetota bacterium]